MIGIMRRDVALEILKAHAPELRELGVASLSLFGSTARDEAEPNSDIDVAVRLKRDYRGLFAFGCLDLVRKRLTELLRAPVDVIPDPEEPGPLKTAIDRDRCLAF